MKKHVLGILVASSMLLLASLSACGPKAVTPTSLPSGPQTLSIIDKDITVNANTNYDITFTVDKNMKDVSLQGKFHAFGGAPNVIEAYIMDDKAYANFLKGHVAEFIWDSDKLSTGFIDHTILAPGKYHLTFTNWFGPDVSPAQQVSATVALNWVY